MHLHPKHAVRHQTVEQAQALLAPPFAPVESIELSVRNRNHMLIVPQDKPIDSLAYRDLLRVSLNHFKPEWKGEGTPPANWHTHRAILRNRADVGAVLIFQSPWASALAMALQGIPGWHQGVAAFGGDNIPCTPTTPNGSSVLSVHVMKLIEHRHGCLLGGYGALVVGADLPAAIARARELERQSELHWHARQVVASQRIGEIHSALLRRRAALIAQRDQNR